MPARAADILPQHEKLVKEARVRFASTPTGEPKLPNVRVEYAIFDNSEDVPRRYLPIDPSEIEMVRTHLGWSNAAIIYIGVPIF